VAPDCGNRRSPPAFAIVAGASTLAHSILERAARVRQNSRWSVPEPELALVVNARGTIVGYTSATT
jgi:fumarylacetoacetate (FAA) hydrolase family protein